MINPVISLNKLKIKKSKNNENQDPFIPSARSSKSKKSSDNKRMSTIKSEQEEVEMQIATDAAKYVPAYLISSPNEQEEADAFTNHNFLFGQLEWTDNLDEEFLNLKDNSKMSAEEYSPFVSVQDNNENYMGFDADYQEFTKKMDEENRWIDNQNDEAEAAGRMLNYLVSTEGIYSPDPNYFERCQPDVSNMMRAILLDWMMEVCNEFTLKRETFYYALNYVDRFMSVHKNIRKEELQLLGVTSMFMAAKMEEVFSPRVADFAKSTDNGYDVTQIVKMEKLMLKDLGWRTTPPTYAMWANWYMNQWDIYISTNEYAMSHEVIQRTPDLTFKTSNETAYARFREVMQIVDLVVLDYSHLQYKPRGLIASILFIILGIHVGEFDIQRIWNEFPYTSSGFLNPNSMFNMLFMDFIFLSFGFQLHDLAPTIQYVSTFMSIPFNYDMPIYAQNKNALEGHFEEFLSYQTHHPLALEFIKRRIMNEEAMRNNWGYE